ncbi:MAG: transcriptional coactivator p15/PC4 family protein [Patescibacteria group bacterium]
MEAQTQVGEAPHTTLLTVDKSEKNQIKVRESLFKDKEYIDIRIFNKNREGEFIPTKKGVTLSKDMMKEVIRGLVKLKI